MEISYDTKVDSSPGRCRKGSPMFWKERGKRGAAFGYLENELISACYSSTVPRGEPCNLRPD